MSLETAGIYYTISLPLSSAMEDCAVRLFYLTLCTTSLQPDQSFYQSCQIRERFVLLDGYLVGVICCGAIWLTNLKQTARIVSIVVAGIVNETYVLCFRDAFGSS